MSEIDDIEEFFKSGQEHANDMDSKCNEVAAPALKARSSTNQVDVKESSKMWAVNGDVYSPCQKTSKTLPPNQYVVEYYDSCGYVFKKFDINIDELIELPDSASEFVINSIEKFWDSKDKFREFKFLWKRGILLWGPPGSGKCLGIDTPIMMFDGSVKKVQDVKVGDLLMGDDSTQRKVLSLAAGTEQLYEVSQVNGDSYVVNESHILSLKRNQIGKRSRVRKDTFKDISVKDYLETTNNFKYRFKGYKVPVEFATKPITLDPYFIGLWLGDGTTGKTSITTPDNEIVEYLYELASNFNLNINIYESEQMGKSAQYDITSGMPTHPGANAIRNELKKLNIFTNKHIPEVYLKNSRDIRLRLLAGLLDSDGHLCKNCFEFSNINKQIIDGICYLAKSLGFRILVTKRTIDTNFKKDCLHWRVNISGHTDTIPTKILRKQATRRKQIKDPLNTGITLKKLEVGDYYGFEIDGNKRFLLGDFTVTHNTSTLQILISKIIKKGGLALFCNNPSMTVTGLQMLRTVEPDRPVLVVMEDIDALIRDHGESNILALLDGEIQIDNVTFIATTNYPERLDARIKNRPSRFDIVKKIGMPNSKAREVYLKAKHPKFKMLAKDEATDELLLWVESTDKFSVAHIKELIILTEIFETPFDEAVTKLNLMLNGNISSDDYKERGDFGFCPEKQSAKDKGYGKKG